MNPQAPATPALTITYWDSSAILNAAVSPAVESRLTSGKHFTRVHALSEVFTVLTGRGLPVPGGVYKLSQDDCATLLRHLMASVELIELDKSEMLDALDQARPRNIQGAHVYDYVHAVASDKAKANELLTRNTSDFVGLTMAKVVWP